LKRIKKFEKSSSSSIAAGHFGSPSIKLQHARYQFGFVVVYICDVSRYLILIDVEEKKKSVLPVKPPGIVTTYF